MEASQLGGYEIRSLIGEGGMGKVYLAHDPTLDRPVALKVIRAQALSADGRERFLREARACSRITHPNIITVYSAGEDNKVPWMAMELIKGRTLRTLVEEGPVDWRTAVRWTVELLSALEKVHAEGIVHRDLKPENVMVTDDGVVKLMDFGLSHLQNSTTLTQEGTTLGTVPYMSPEQVLGKKADARSDLFSMATILHEMLTGDHPFRGEHPMAVMYSIQHDTPRPIRVHSQDYPPGLQDVLDRAFSKELDKRFQTAEEFREALTPMLPELSGIMPAAPGGGSSRRLAIAGIAIAAVAVALVSFQIVRSQRSSTDAVQYNQLGHRLLGEGNLSEAEVEFRKAIQADNKYSIAYHNLGILLLQKGDTTEALSNFEHAGRLSDDYADPIYMRAVIYEMKGKTGEAERLYREAIAVNPNHLQAYSNLAALLMDTNRNPEATTLLDKALTIPPDTAEDRQAIVLILTKRATLAEQQGDLDAAQRYRNRATTMTPPEPEAP